MQLVQQSAATLYSMKHKEKQMFKLFQLAQLTQETNSLTFKQCLI